MKVTVLVMAGAVAVTIWMIVVVAANFPARMRPVWSVAFLEVEAVRVELELEIEEEVEVEVEAAGTEERLLVAVPVELQSVAVELTAVEFAPRVQFPTESVLFACRFTCLFNLNCALERCCP